MEIKYHPDFLKDCERLFSSKLRYSIPRWFKDAYWEAKYAFQRVYKGYDERMVFDFHSQFTEMAIKVLKEFRENKRSHPMEFANVDEWVAVIDEMIEGFEAAKRLDGADNWGKGDKDESRSKDDDDRKTFDHGMALFVKYFFNLWD